MTTRRIACASAIFLAATVVATAPTPVHARIIPPPVPAGLEVPAGNKPSLEAHAVGTQNYLCLPSGAGFAWVLLGPRATLFSKNSKQLLTHFVSPNPEEGGIARITWQHSADTSAIWGQTFGSSSDPTYVSLESVPWQLLRVVGTQEGPKGGHKLAGTTWVQRVRTSGGLPPITGCSSSASVGARSYVPYAADDIFYKED